MASKSNSSEDWFWKNRRRLSIGSFVVAFVFIGIGLFAESWFKEPDDLFLCRLCFDRSNNNHRPLDTLADVPSDLRRDQGSSAVKSSGESVALTTTASGDPRFAILQEEIAKANREIYLRQQQEIELLWAKLIALGAMLAALFTWEMRQANGNSGFSIYKFLKKPHVAFALVGTLFVMLLMDIRFIWFLNVGADIGRWIFEVEKCLGIGINPACTASQGLVPDDSYYMGRLGYESWMHRESPANATPAVQLLNTRVGNIILVLPILITALILFLSVACMRLEGQPWASPNKKEHEGQSESSSTPDRATWQTLLRGAVLFTAPLAGVLLSLIGHYVTRIGYQMGKYLIFHAVVGFFGTLGVALLLWVRADPAGDPTPKRQEQLLSPPPG